MNLKFSQIINAILSELEPELEPAFFRWVESSTTTNARWCGITDRFENALVDAIKNGNYLAAKREGEVYKSDMLSLIREFHSKNGVNETISFLNALERI